MCSFMVICQCCFAIVKVLLKKVTYLLTYLMHITAHVPARMRRRMVLIQGSMDVGRRNPSVEFHPTTSACFLATEAYRLPAPDCGTTFQLNYGGQTCLSRCSDRNLKRSTHTRSQDFLVVVLTTQTKTLKLLY